MPACPATFDGSAPPGWKATVLVENRAAILLTKTSTSFQSDLLNPPLSNFFRSSVKSVSRSADISLPLEAHSRITRWWYSPEIIAADYTAQTPTVRQSEVPEERNPLFRFRWLTLRRAF